MIPRSPIPHASDAPFALHPRTVAVALTLILLAAALLRLVALHAWPVFCDEDNYAFAVRQMQLEAISEWPREVARSCAKPPLLLMTAVPLSRVLGSELLALRVLSALGGVVTVAGCYALGRKLGGPSVGLATAALYAVSPWAVLHERMALLDGPVATLVLVAAVVTWESVDRSSLALAFGAALAGGAAVLTKQPGLLALSVPLFFVVSRRSWRTLVLAGIAAAGPALSWLALRFAPGANRLQYQISNRWTPLGSVAENWGRLQEAVQTYLPAALLLFALLGAASLLRRSREGALLVSGQVIAWTASWILLSNFAPSRYHLPALPYVFALVALAALETLPAWLPRHATAGRWLGVLCVLALATPGAIDSLRLVRDHRHAALASLDDWQYRSGWPSGYGYTEARAFVLAHATPGASVACLLHGCHQVAAACDDMPGLTSLGVLDPEDAEIEARLAAARTDPVLAIAELDDTELRAFQARLGSTWEVTRLARFPRPGSDGGPVVVRIEDAKTSYSSRTQPH